MFVDTVQIQIRTKKNKNKKLRDNTKFWLRAFQVGNYLQCFLLDFLSFLNEPASCE